MRKNKNKYNWKDTDHLKYKYRYQRKIFNKRKGYNLHIRYLSTKEKTYNICKDALANNMKNIRYVPKSILSHRLFLEVIDEIKIKEVCDFDGDTSYQRSKVCLKYIPIEFKNIDICIAGIQYNKANYQFINEYYKDMCKLYLI